ncbi:N-acetyltransferase family protein [Pseudonocardia halophobica]|uniref:GNAT family N-acetyltransferase n=1 Tax=Pseudonocardia halophobica TaxID=29401 RepID=UPI003D89F736
MPVLLTEVAPPVHRIAEATCLDVVAVVDACSAASLAARFLVAVPPPRAEVLARLGRTLDHGTTLAAFAPQPVGVVGVHPDGERRAELCALVADAHQGRGVGAALLASVLRAPRWQGWTLHAYVGHGNRAAHGLLRPAAAHRHLLPDCVEYVLPPREAR